MQLRSPSWPPSPWRRRRPAVPCTLPREQPQWWKLKQYEQVEQVKNNPCGVLFLGDSITDYWKREGKQVWEREIQTLPSLQLRHFRRPDHQPDLPHHGFRHTGPDGTQTLHRHDRH
ncbi:MAG: hypothetical protein ACLT8E_03600 [Akkermansia sp.]